MSTTIKANGDFTFAPKIAKVLPGSIVTWELGDTVSPAFEYDVFSKGEVIITPLPPLPPPPRIPTSSHSSTAVASSTTIATRPGAKPFSSKGYSSPHLQSGHVLSARRGFISTSSSKINKLDIKEEDDEGEDEDDDGNTVWESVSNNSNKSSDTDDANSRSDAGSHGSSNTSSSSEETSIPPFIFASTLDELPALGIGYTIRRSPRKKKQTKRSGSPRKQKEIVAGAADYSGGASSIDKKETKEEAATTSTTITTKAPTVEVGGGGPTISTQPQPQPPPLPAPPKSTTIFLPEFVFDSGALQLTSASTTGSSRNLSATNNKWQWTVPDANQIRLLLEAGGLPADALAALVSGHATLHLKYYSELYASHGMKGLLCIDLGMSSVMIPSNHSNDWKNGSSSSNNSHSSISGPLPSTPTRDNNKNAYSNNFATSPRKNTTSTTATNSNAILLMNLSPKRLEAVSPSRHRSTPSFSAIDTISTTRSKPTHVFSDQKQLPDETHATAPRPSDHISGTESGDSRMNYDEPQQKQQQQPHGSSVVHASVALLSPTRTVSLSATSNNHQITRSSLSSTNADDAGTAISPPSSLFHETASSSQFMVHSLLSDTMNLPQIHRSSAAKDTKPPPTTTTTTNTVILKSSSKSSSPASSVITKSSSTSGIPHTELARSRLVELMGIHAATSIDEGVAHIVGQQSEKEKENGRNSDDDEDKGVTPTSYRARNSRATGIGNNNRAGGGTSSNSSATPSRNSRGSVGPRSDDVPLRTHSTIEAIEHYRETEDDEENADDANTNNNDQSDVFTVDSTKDGGSRGRLDNDQGSGRSSNYHYNQQQQKQQHQQHHYRYKQLNGASTFEDVKQYVESGFHSSRTSLDHLARLNTLRARWDTAVPSPAQLQEHHQQNQDPRHRENEDYRGQISGNIHHHTNQDDQNAQHQQQQQQRLRAGSAVSVSSLQSSESGLSEITRHSSATAPTVIVGRKKLSKLLPVHALQAHVVELLLSSSSSKKEGEAAEESNDREVNRSSDVASVEVGAKEGGQPADLMIRRETASALVDQDEKLKTTTAAPILESTPVAAASMVMTENPDVVSSCHPQATSEIVAAATIYLQGYSATPSSVTICEGQSIEFKALAFDEPLPPMFTPQSRLLHRSSISSSSSSSTPPSKSSMVSRYVNDEESRLDRYMISVDRRRTSISSSSSSSIKNSGNESANTTVDASGKGNVSSPSFSIRRPSSNNKNDGFSSSYHDSNNSESSILDLKVCRHPHHQLPQPHEDESVTGIDSRPSSSAKSSSSTTMPKCTCPFARSTITFFESGVYDWTEEVYVFMKGSIVVLRKPSVSSPNSPVTSSPLPHSTSANVTPAPVPSASSPSVSPSKNSSVGLPQPSDTSASPDTGNIKQPLRATAEEAVRAAVEAAAKSGRAALLPAAAAAAAAASTSVSGGGGKGGGRKKGGRKSVKGKHPSSASSVSTEHTATTTTTTTTGMTMAPDKEDGCTVPQDGNGTHEESEKLALEALILELSSTKSTVSSTSKKQRAKERKKQAATTNVVPPPSETLSLKTDNIGISKELSSRVIMATASSLQKGDEDEVISASVAPLPEAPLLVAPLPVAPLLVAPLPVAPPKRVDAWAKFLHAMRTKTAKDGDEWIGDL